jgi:hypothetical protein
LECILSQSFVISLISQDIKVSKASIKTIVNVIVKIIDIILGKCNLTSKKQTTGLNKIAKSNASKMGIIIS